jgi:ABC-type branched-subunit amino acid transport system substrate-binding protein
MLLAKLAETIAGPCFYWGIAIADAVRVAAQMALGGIHGHSLEADDDWRD